MTPERDIEKLQEQLLALRDDVIALKVWRDNQNAKGDSSTRWTIALISAGIAAASLLLQWWMATGAHLP